MPLRLHTIRTFKLPTPFQDRWLIRLLILSVSRNVLLGSGGPLVSLFVDHTGHLCFLFFLESSMCTSALIAAELPCWDASFELFMSLVSFHLSLLGR